MWVWLDLLFHRVALSLSGLKHLASSWRHSGDFSRQFEAYNEHRKPSHHLSSALRTISSCIDESCRDIVSDAALLKRKNKNFVLHVFHFQSSYLSSSWLYFCARLCSWWDVIKVVCEIGKFTIRDAILFHKFCIFNKEYFVFLAHRILGC